MPTYVYRCPCGQQTEAVRSVADRDHAPACAGCGQATRRTLTPVPTVFKGSGFYRTDSRK